MEPFIGQIQAFGFNFVPVGWAKCDGQLLAISQNDALFSLLGTQYGGDGRTTFGLPDLRGRLPMHRGQGPGLSNRVMGQKGGTIQEVLTTNQIPSHIHGATTTTQTLINVNNGTGGENIANGQFIASRNGGFSEEPSTGAFLGAPNSISTTTTDLTGNTQAHTNLQPYLTVTYCIALFGIFPSRS